MRYNQAPVQLAMHGHASTTGIDTLDYYVSYAGFSEPQVQKSGVLRACYAVSGSDLGVLCGVRY